MVLTLFMFAIHNVTLKPKSLSLSLYLIDKPFVYEKSLHVMGILNKLATEYELTTVYGIDIDHF